MPKPTFSSSELSFDEIAEHFHLPIVEASLKLGVCNSTIKRICTENGVLRWPYRKIMAGKTVEEIKREAIVALQSQGEGGTAALSGGDMPAGGTAGDVTSAPGDSTAFPWGDGDLDFVSKRRRLDDGVLAVAPMPPPVSPTPASPHPVQDQRVRGHSGSSGQLAAWASHGALPADAMRQSIGVSASPASASGPSSSAGRLRVHSSQSTPGGASQAAHHHPQQQQLHAAPRLPLPPAFRAALQQPLLNPASFPLPFPLPLAKRVESAVRRGLRRRGRGDEEGFPWGGLEWDADRWWDDEGAPALAKEGGVGELADGDAGSGELPKEHPCSGGHDDCGQAKPAGGNVRRFGAETGDKDAAVPLSFGEEGNLTAVEASARLEAVLRAAAQRASEGLQYGLAGGLSKVATASPDEKAVLKFVFGPFMPHEWQ